jgi:tRNA threonylcarbamoyladenosine biosynthesis protein TsaE
MEFITRSCYQTQRLAEALAKHLKKGDVLLLQGPLGVGKTVFVKGILRGLGFKKDLVRSPSFTIIKEYRGKRKVVYHVDLYRIKNRKELFNLGYEDYFYSPKGITVIEWADKVEGMIPRGIKINFKHLRENTRKIKISFKNLKGIRRLSYEVVRSR